MSRARELIGRCSIREELGDDEAIRRADEIAAAAAHYAEASGTGNAAVLDEHLRDEFELHDADATMAADPYLHHVPVLTGGVGREAVHRFTATTSSPRVRRTPRRTGSPALWTRTE